MKLISISLCLILLIEIFRGHRILAIIIEGRIKPEFLGFFPSLQITILTEIHAAVSGTLPSLHTSY